MTSHRFGGIDFEPGPPRRWRGTCLCGHAGAWTDDKETAWWSITGHFMSTPEAQALLVQRALRKLAE